MAVAATPPFRQDLVEENTWDEGVRATILGRHMAKF